MKKLPSLLPLLMLSLILLLSSSACLSRPSAGESSDESTTVPSGPGNSDTITSTDKTGMTTGTTKEGATAGPIDGTELSIFLQTVALPDNLTVSFDPDNVKTVASARIYIAREQLFDVDNARQQLLRRAVIDSKEYAEGPWFETGDASLKEYLCVYHGVIKGGLIYTLIRDGVWLTMKLTDVIVDEPGPEDYYGYGRFEYALKKSSFRSGADLPFMSFANTRTALMDLLHKSGFPEMEISETYSLDLETIKAQYEIFLAESSVLYPEREMSDKTWSESDTCYLFLMRQLIDQIPVSDQGWQGQGATSSPAGNPMPISRTTVYWTHDGLAAIRAYGLYELLESEPEKPLIGPVQALQVLLEDLCKIIISRPTWIESVELCYVSVQSKQDSESFTLLPAWVICLGEELETAWPDEQSPVTIKDYEYVVIDAITGSKLSR
ncbi:MAG: hypothetical protein SCM11_03300 [Bacillota bacterium]|nr:hypothetical protein [Bacillota bacterium]